MKFRFLISIITLIGAAFLCSHNNEASADNFCAKASYMETYLSCDASDYEISSPDYTLQPPRPTNYASFGQCRTHTRSHIKTVSSNRYHLFIAGKPIDRSFVKVYQLILNLFPTGLNNSSRHFISLGKLII